jgi:heptosyltransferase-2
MPNLRRVPTHLLSALHYWLINIVFGTWHKLMRIGRSKASANRAESPQSILIVRLDHIGDVVLSSAFFREVRRLYPKARITVVTTDRTKNLLEACPYIDELLSKPTHFNSVKSVSHDFAATRRFCEDSLAGRTFDVAILPRWGTDLFFASLVCLYSNAPTRIAYTTACSFEKRILNLGFNIFFTDLIPRGPLKHEVEHDLDVVRQLGGYLAETQLEFWCDSSDYAWAEERLRESGIPPHNRLFAFGVGAANSRRRWPISCYAELINRLALNDDFIPVIICGPDDTGLVSELQGLTSRPVFVPPSPSLRQTGALLSRCTIFIGNDSGPLHIATAVGLPVVEISCHPLTGNPGHENAPARFGPYSKKARVLRPVRAKAPCRSGCEGQGPHCITGVEVTDVHQAVLEASGALLSPPI